MFSGGTLSFALYMALKEIWKRKWKVLLIILAISSGVIAYITTDALMKGWSQQIADTTINLWTSHIKITPRGSSFIWDYNSIKRMILSNGEVSKYLLGLSGRINLDCIVRGKSEDVRGIYATIVGIDPVEEERVTTLKDIIVEGTYPSGTIWKGALIGCRMSKRLGLEPGDSIIVTLPTGDRIPFKVTGIFCSNYYRFDEQVIFASKMYLSKKLGLGGNVSEVLVRLKNREYSDYVSRELKRMLPSNLTVSTWKELMGYVYVMLTTEGYFAQLINGLILLVGGLGVASTMILTVSSRVRYIGILKAIGANNDTIFSIYLLEAAIIGIISVLLGDLLGAILVSYLEGHPIPVPESVAAIYGTARWPFVLDPSSFLLSNLYALTICILAGIYPAIKASKLDPVEAIRYVF